MFAPFFLASLGGFIWGAVELATGAGGGFVVTMVVTGGIAALTGYQTIQSLRDALEREPRAVEGEVDRVWSRFDFIPLPSRMTLSHLFTFRSHYILVQRQIFRIEPEDFVHIERGEPVRVTYFPHANTVARVERLRGR